MSEQRMSDAILIARVLDGIWAPRDGDPQAPAQFLEEDRVTNNDVIRARRALNRVSPPVVPPANTQEDT